MSLLGMYIISLWSASFFFCFVMYKYYFRIKITNVFGIIFIEKCHKMFRKILNRTIN